MGFSRVRLDAEAEERERGLGENRATDRHRGEDDDRRHGVGHDVPKHQPDVARADRAPRIDVVGLLDRQDRRPEHARDRRPAQHADGDDDRQHARSLLSGTTESSRIANRMYGKRQEHVRGSHDRAIGQTRRSSRRARPGAARSAPRRARPRRRRSAIRARRTPLARTRRDPGRRSPSGARATAAAAARPRPSAC